MLKQLTPVILISALAACSSPMERRHANGNDDYVNVKEQALLVIPRGLKTPQYSREYQIPQLPTATQSGLLGKELDIRPPLQVLPMAEGTRVEEGSDNIKIVIESVGSELDLKKEIFDSLLTFLKRKNIGIQKQNFQKGIIETDWIENQEVIDSKFWGKDKFYTLKQRYEFDVQVRPQSRMGSLVIKLIQHEESYDGDKQEIALTSDDKRRYTIDMLNSAVSYLNIERMKAQKARRIKQSLGIDVSLVEGKHAYWQADSNFDNTWERLRLVLPEMGFEIADINRNKKLFFLNYNDDSGFWSTLLNNEKLPLKKGGYRLELSNGKDGAKTRIYLKDLSGQSLDNDTIIGIYKAFSSLMQQDRKVR